MMTCFFGLIQCQVVFSSQRMSLSRLAQRLPTWWAERTMNNHHGVVVMRTALPAVSSIIPARQESMNFVASFSSHVIVHVIPGSYYWKYTVTNMCPTTCGSPSTYVRMTVECTRISTNTLVSDSYCTQPKPEAGFSCPPMQPCPAGGMSHHPEMPAIYIVATICSVSIWDLCCHSVASEWPVSIQ
jgi:hypothetical protein